MDDGAVRRDRAGRLCAAVAAALARVPPLAAVPCPACASLHAPAGCLAGRPVLDAAVGAAHPAGDLAGGTFRRRRAGPWPGVGTAGDHGAWLAPAAVDRHLVR